MPEPLIVVVDDHQTMLELFTDVLEEEGYRVVTCNARDDAVPCIKREHPDLVILDLWLETPNDGWDICAELASDPSTSDIPIVLCTATDAERREQPAEVQPASLAFLDKPFEINDLLAVVETALAP
jgi:CheY-like chemotaxis protein